MSDLFGSVTRWLYVDAKQKTCPKCADRLSNEYAERDTPPPPAPELEDAYVRAPNFQEHWRGIPALQCPTCGYAEADD